MNKNDVCGKFPDFCYKAFTCEKYAKQFMENGSFRMGCLYSYRTIEDESRRDSTEGIGRTKEPGIVTYYGYTQNLKEKPAIVQKPGYQEHHIEQSNPVYCLCTSLPTVNLNYMRNQFGQYIVKIGNPKEMAVEINEYFFNEGQSIRIEGCPVDYNKGKKQNRELTNSERADLAYKQKCETFIKDHEFRIVVIRLGEVCTEPCIFLDEDEEVEPECKFIEINLGKKLSYLIQV